MTTIYRLGDDPRGFARIRFGSQARDCLGRMTPGRPLPTGIAALEARVFVKDGKSPPLGDCPRAREAIVLSTRARRLVGPMLHNFDWVPVDFIGAGVEKRSGSWYPHPLEVYDNPGEVRHPFFVVHPVTTYLEGQVGPQYAPPPPGFEDSADGEPVELDLAHLASMMAKATRSHVDAGKQLAAQFRNRPPPAVFAFGPWANVYFAQEFVDAVAGAKLTGFTFEEVVRLGAAKGARSRRKVVEPEPEPDDDGVADLDWQALEDALTTAIASQVAAFSAANPQRVAYGFALDCNAQYANVLLCLNTREALDATARRYARVDDAQEIARRRAQLEWSLGDWDHQGFNLGSPDWEAAMPMLDGFAELPGEETAERFMRTCCRALLRAERDGAFAALPRTIDFRVACIDHDEDLEQGDARLDAVRQAMDAG